MVFSALHHQPFAQARLKAHQHIRTSKTSAAVCTMSGAGSSGDAVLPVAEAPRGSSPEEPGWSGATRYSCCRC